MCNFLDPHISGRSARQERLAGLLLKGLQESLRRQRVFPLPSVAKRMALALTDRAPEPAAALTRS